MKLKVGQHPFQPILAACGTNQPSQAKSPDLPTQLSRASFSKRERLASSFLPRLSSRKSAAVGPKRGQDTFFCSKHPGDIPKHGLPGITFTQ